MTKSAGKNRYSGHESAFSWVIENQGKVRGWTQRFLPAPHGERDNPIKEPEPGSLMSCRWVSTRLGGLFLRQLPAADVFQGR
jgi:hypothetical protein